MLCMFRLCILCIVCKCVLFHCHRVSTQLQLNISYRVILRQLVINGLPSYTTISKAAVGNNLQLRCFTGFMQFSYCCCWNLNNIKPLKIKIVIFTIKRAKIILLLQFSCSQSVWWLYIQSVYWHYCRAGPVCTEWVWVWVWVWVCVCVSVSVSVCRAVWFVYL
jgi:hypothetical protein